MTDRGVKNGPLDAGPDGVAQQVIEHATSPRNAGSLPDADGYASLTRECGDDMQVWLKVEDSRIVRATFWTHGCVQMIAAGSVTTELATGRSLFEALGIDAERISERLGGLGEAEHCADLASETLKAAIRDCLSIQREPWKKAYRRK